MSQRTLPGATEYASEIGAEFINAPKPVFTRKLSWDEQSALSDADFSLYVDWLFAVNEPICRRREFDQRNPNRDWDKEREISRGDDYEVTPKQSGSGR